jgi:hypothetical protein
MNARHVYPGTNIGKKSPRIEEHERLRTAELAEPHERVVGPVPFARLSVTPYL